MQTLEDNKVWNRSRIKELEHLIIDGKSTEFIAKHFGCTENNIRGVITRCTVGIRRLRSQSNARANISDLR